MLIAEITFMNGIRIPLDDQLRPENQQTTMTTRLTSQDNIEMSETDLGIKLSCSFRDWSAFIPWHFVKQVEYAASPKKKNKTK